MLAQDATVQELWESTRYSSSTKMLAQDTTVQELRISTRSSSQRRRSLRIRQFRNYRYNENDRSGWGSSFCHMLLWSKLFQNKRFLMPLNLPSESPKVHQNLLRAKAYGKWTSAVHIQQARYDLLTSLNKFPPPPKKKRITLIALYHKMTYQWTFCAHTRVVHISVHCFSTVKLMQTSSTNKRKSTWSLTTNTSKIERRANPTLKKKGTPLECIT